MDKAYGKWGYGLGNGTGLIVTERDGDQTETFEMHPELFADSYLPYLLVGAEDIDDQTVGDTRWISYYQERRGLVSITARPA